MEKKTPYYRPHSSEIPQIVDTLNVADEEYTYVIDEIVKENRVF